MDHKQCQPEAHDRSLPEDGEQAVAADGLLACNDCGKPAFYCSNDENYHHVDPDARCFLIQERPATAAEHYYAQDAAGYAGGWGSN